MALDLKALADLSDLVLSRDSEKRKKLAKSENQSAALKLIRVGSSAGGARSKAIIRLGRVWGMLIVMKRGLIPTSSWSCSCVNWA